MPTSTTALTLKLTHRRLRRISATACLQLWVLSPSDDTDIYHLHSLQCLAWLMVRTILRLTLFHHWQLHL